MSKVFWSSLIRPSLTVTSAVAPSWCEHCTARACCRGAWFQAHLDRLEDVGVDGDGEVLSGDGRVGLDGDVLELAAGQRYVPNNSSRTPVLVGPCLAQEAHRNRFTPPRTTALSPPHPSVLNRSHARARSTTHSHNITRQSTVDIAPRVHGVHLAALRRRLLRGRIGRDERVGPFKGLARERRGNARRDGQEGDREGCETHRGVQRWCEM